MKIKVLYFDGGVNLGGRNDKRWSDPEFQITLHAEHGYISIYEPKSKVRKCVPMARAMYWEELIEAPASAPAGKK